MNRPIGGVQGQYRLGDDPEPTLVQGHTDGGTESATHAGTAMEAIRNPSVANRVEASQRASGSPEDGGG